MKLCSKCGINPRVLAPTLSSKCDPCLKEYLAEWYRKNADRIKNNRLKRLYGISLDTYKEMLRMQGGVCAICKGLDPNGKDLAVDHCHSTGKNRSLLCSGCNLAIGSVRESTATLYRAIEYLNSYAHS